MDKPTVYLESSVVSYRTARPSRDVIVLSHLEITRIWWENHIDEYSLRVSQVVLDEIRRGDPDAAAERLKEISGVPLLPIGPDIEGLAVLYQEKLRLPEKSLRDILHLAIASVHAVDYLVTWNCRHIANARVRRHIQELNGNEGISTPIICTPEELLDENDLPTPDL